MASRRVTETILSSTLSGSTARTTSAVNISSSDDFTLFINIGSYASVTNIVLKYLVSSDGVTYYYLQDDATNFDKFDSFDLSAAKKLSVHGKVVSNYMKVVVTPTSGGAETIVMDIFLPEK